MLATACAGGGRDGTEAGDLGPPDNVVSVVLGVASLPLSVANAFAGWKQVQEDAHLPWIAPDKRVKAFVKDQLPTAFDLDTEEYRWRVGDDWIYPFYEYNPRLSDYILRDPISKNWEYSGHAKTRRHDVFPRPHLMPDYDFYVVSIKPLAVVMVPTGVHRRAKLSPAKRKNLSDRADLPISSIRYSTRFPVPKGRTLWWFSTARTPPAQPVSFDDTGTFQVLVAGTLRLTCTKTGGEAECLRVAP